MGPLDGNVAIITGGTGALGRVVSKAFIDAGAHVTVTYVANTELPGFEAVVPPARRDAVKADLTSRADVDALVARVLTQHRRVDTLLNLAGGFAAGAVVDTSDED